MFTFSWSLSGTERADIDLAPSIRAVLRLNGLTSKAYLSEQDQMYSFFSTVVQLRALPLHHPILQWKPLQLADLKALPRRLESTRSQIP